MRSIRIGIGVGDIAPREGGLEDVLADFRRAEAAGFQSVWVPNIFGGDALTLSALGGPLEGKPGPDHPPPGTSQRHHARFPREVGLPKPGV